MGLVRSARGMWAGSLVGGQGSVEMMTAAGPASATLDWGARSSQEQAVSTPEELLAAAQATCYNMALAHRLSLAGTPPAQLETRVEVDFSPTAGITGMVLHVRGNVPSLTPEQFDLLTLSALEICTMARALAGIDITLKATLSPSSPSAATPAPSSTPAAPSTPALAPSAPLVSLLLSTERTEPLGLPAADPTLFGGVRHRPARPPAPPVGPAPTSTA